MPRPVPPPSPPAFPRSLCATVLLALVAAALTTSGGAASQAVAAPGIHPISGRQIAAVMSHVAADWLDRPGRGAEERPERALDAIGIKAGQVVADVGAGSGYYTVRLARRVAPGGRVYATDIQPEMIALLRERLAREKVSGVDPVLATDVDPRLPEGSLDLVVMVDVYHELSHPQAMLRQLKRSLKPGGRLVLIEFRKEDPDVPIRFEHKMSVTEARLELEAEGYRLDRVSDVLPWQHILIFGVRS